MIVHRGTTLLQKCNIRRIISSCHNFSQKQQREIEYVTPSALLITCMDSRIDPTRYIDMKPGSTFIIRNPGNFIPHSADIPRAQVSTALAGLEFTTGMESIKDVIVCGHSDCKAIQMLQSVKRSDTTAEIDMEGPFASWLVSRGGRTWDKYLTEQEKEGSVSVYSNLTNERLMTKLNPEGQLPTHDVISQINVLQQMHNVASWDFMKGALSRGIRLHGMWLDVNVQMSYIFDWRSLKFVELKSKKGAAAFAQM